MENKFEPITTKEIINILSLTIKKDDENKLATFLCCLSAFTDNAQFNISFNAPSSTGKTYIPSEIVSLFPKEDVLEIGYCSPTAFFHDAGVLDKATNKITVDLSKKIILFYDQPHNMLLERLRPFLSHDSKELEIRITDKTQKNGMKVKTVLLKGYAAVIFCSAGFHIDEQESTRFLLLSPNIDQDKIKRGITNAIQREVDRETYDDLIRGDSKRQLLIERIRAIRDEHISDVKITDKSYLEGEFFSDKKILLPRHQRDIKRLIHLVKCMALVNLWDRKREGNVIYATKDDIKAAFELWDSIAYCQELSLPPYIYTIFKEIFIKVYEAKSSENKRVGITRQEILKKHYEIYGKPISLITLNQEIIPLLETVGLIEQEQNQAFKNQKLIYIVDRTLVSKEVG